MVKKEIDLGSISGSVTLAPTQSLVSFITATPTANATIIWPACFPGLVVTVANLASVTYTLTCEIAGNTTNTVVIAANTTVQIVHDQLLDKPIGGIIVGGGSATYGINYASYTGTADAILFPAAINVAVITSTGPDLTTLGTPGTGDVGKVLILVNTNTTQTTVTTAANKILNGTASTYDTLTAPAHAGSVAILVATNGFWNYGVFGTGTWVLSEV